MIISFLEQPVPYLAFAVAVAGLLFFVFRQGRRIKRLEERTNLPPPKDPVSAVVSRIQDRPAPKAARRRRRKVAGA